MLGRLAIDNRVKGQGLGKALLGNALKRIVRSKIAVYALIVEAKDQNAKEFYCKLGFIPFSNAENKLFLPLEKIKMQLKQENN